MVLGIAAIACVFALRFFAPAAPFAVASDGPPPAAEDRLGVAADASPGSADDPSDVDDGDDDPDDAALPNAIAAAVPHAAALPASWRLVPLTDKHARDPLFRPPRAA